MKTFNSNHKKLMNYLKEFRSLGKRDPSFDINNIINTNLLISFNEQLAKENFLRRKESSILRAWNSLLDIKVPFWNTNKRGQYERLLSNISYQRKELKRIINIEDARSDRFKKEYDKIEKGINIKVK